VAYRQREASSTLTCCKSLRIFELAFVVLIDSFVNSSGSAEFDVIGQCNEGLVNAVEVGAKRSGRQSNDRAAVATAKAIAAARRLEDFAQKFGGARCSERDPTLRRSS